MTPSRLPLVGALREAGADDRVFDALLLVGPLVLLLVALLGRSALTEGLAAAYIVAFVGYVAYRSVAEAS